MPLGIYMDCLIIQLMKLPIYRLLRHRSVLHTPIKIKNSIAVKELLRYYDYSESERCLSCFLVLSVSLIFVVWHIPQHNSLTTEFLL